MPRTRRTGARFAAAGLCAALVLGLVAGCSDDPTPKRPVAKPKTAKLTLGVWGKPEELKAYTEMVADYNETTEAIDVELKSWPDHATFQAALTAGTDLPDLFMTSRRDLAQVRNQELNAPLLDLLDERGVDFGDGFFREALDAFASDDDLQCMPYAVSPTVIYYNTDLVDFDLMRERELPAPVEDKQEWDYEVFTAAVKFASRPRRGSKGLYVEPSLEGLAPFIYSGGGDVFNDDTDPTSLDFSSDDSRSALTQTLEVLRDPKLTLSEEQLAQQSAVQWFKAGKLGMIEGDRTLVPELRAATGLNFDVMPVPEIEDASTVGDLSALCITAGSGKVSQAADFLVYAVGDEAMSKVAEAGYVVPASLQVAISDAFLQPGQMPAHAGVFNAGINDLVIPPLLSNWTELEAAVGPSIQLLLTTPIPEIEALTTQIDEDSQAVLDPNYVPPSEEVSPSPGSASSGAEPSSPAPSTSSSSSTG